MGCKPFLEHTINPNCGGGRNHPPLSENRVFSTSENHNDNSNHKVTDKENEYAIEGSDSSNGNIAEYVVPKKNTKKELANPKLSWFEENGIQKNIKARDEFAKKLGIKQLLTN